MSFSVSTSVGASFAVALQGRHGDQAALPLRGREDVRHDRPHLLQRRVDLLAGAASHVCHGRTVSRIGPIRVSSAYGCRGGAGAGACPDAPREDRMSTQQPMSNGDAAWLHMDRPTNLMVITSVMWFDEPLDAERLRDVIAERLVGRFVRFRQRAVESPLPFRGPHWEDDPDFDLDRHVHHRGLSAPGGPAELTELVSDLMSTPLDRSKPLWDLYLVDGYGSGSALVSRMHHCIADGIALARVMLSLTDEHPDAGFAGDRPAGPRPGRAAALRRTATAPVRAAAAPVRAARGVAGTLLHEGADALVHPSKAAHLAGEAARDARVLRKLLLTGPDAKTVLKGSMGATRRAA